MWYEYIRDKHAEHRPGEYYHYIHTNGIGITYTNEIFIHPKKAPCNKSPLHYFDPKPQDSWKIANQLEVEQLFTKLKLENL